DYLPYFNEAVPHPERVLVDSDLDWGQDLRRLELRAAQLGIAKLSIAYRGTADLKREPLAAFVVPGSRGQVSGGVVISDIGRQRAGVVAMELDQGARELGGARVAAREIVRLELVATRPERGERSDEEGDSRRREGKEQQRRVRRRHRHAERSVEARLPGEP